MDKHLILSFNPPTSRGVDLHKRELLVNYDLTADRRRWREAKIVLFHMAHLSWQDMYWMLTRGAELKRKLGQLWVSRTKECDLHRFAQRCKPLQQFIDISMSYRIDSDVPILNVKSDYDKRLLGPVYPKEEGKLINAFISSNVHKSRRKSYLRDLMQHLDVHCYGRLFQTHEAGEPGRGKSGKQKNRQKKREIIRCYKFTLAFENAIARDYVTEKFYQPLLEGSVPVYMGAPNIEDFTPGNHCYINVSDYASPAELANDLKRLDEDDELYMRFFEWKEKPLRARLLELLATQSPSGMTRLCQKLNEILNV
jgi:hypothetical protein